MSNFALDTNTSYGDVISSVNYALANLNNNNITANTIVQIVGNIIANANVVTTNSNTGQVGSVLQGTVSYLYNYINVKYANDPTGSVAFSSNCTNRQYFGTRNSNSATISNNPADYNWTQVAGGFGTTKGLYYTPYGGGVIYFDVATTAPTIRFQPVLDDTPIPLQNLANSIVTANTITPGAVTNVAIAANTIVANNIQTGAITALQIASRTLTNAQIALSTITGNLVQSQTLTGSLIALNTITGNLVAQNTITGNLIVPGTITGNLIQANTVITSTLASSGVTPGVNSGYGFWLTSNVGDAYFGGNVNIGQNLYVQGLITSATLNANTVQTTTIGANAVTQTGTSYSTSNYGTGARQLSYAGTDGIYYYWSEPVTVVPVFTNNVVTTTSTVNNTLSGQIALSGTITANVAFAPYVTATMIKYSYTLGGATYLPPTTITQSPLNFFVANSPSYLTQTIFPDQFVTSTSINYTAASVPESTFYYWGYAAAAVTTTYPANVYVFYSNVTNQSIAVTNLKR